jgi:hypothetical protein
MGPTSTPAANAASPKAIERLGPVITAGTVTKEKAAVYWVGVIPWKQDDSASRPPPMHFMNIGPVTFQTWSTPWEGKDESGAGIRGRYPGSLVRLTESQVSRLKSELMRTVVRWRERKGRHAHGYLVRQESAAEIEEATKRWKLNEVQVAEATAKIAVFREDDEPVSAYIYCVKTDLPEGSNARPGGIPPSAWDTGIDLPN